MKLRNPFTSDIPKPDRVLQTNAAWHVTTPWWRRGIRQGLLTLTTNGELVFEAYDITGMIIRERRPALRLNDVAYIGERPHWGLRRFFFPLPGSRELILVTKGRREYPVYVPKIERWLDFISEPLPVTTESTVAT